MQCSEADGKVEPGRRCGVRTTDYTIGLLRDQPSHQETLRESVEHVGSRMIRRPKKSASNRFVGK